jgi:hypothetical protein
MDAKIRAVVPVSVEEGWKGDLVFSAFLINPAPEEKEELPILGLNYEKTQSGGHVFSLDIEIGSLDSGDYSMLIYIDVPEPGVRLMARAPFSVE